MTGPTNLRLPEGDAATTVSVKDWLARFAAWVSEVHYASVYPFWHDAIVIFGTYEELVRSRRAWTDTQWDNVWPRTADFIFDLANTLVLASPDGAVAVTPWTSTGFHPDGRWVGVHSHMSLQRGVPQDSHGKRPVSESGTLCYVDGVQGRGARCRRAFMLPTLGRRYRERKRSAARVCKPRCVVRSTW